MLVPKSNKNWCDKDILRMNGEIILAFVLFRKAVVVIVALQAFEFLVCDLKFLFMLKLFYT